MPTPTTYPSLVGGLCLPLDLAPSIIVAIFYGLLIPPWIYRLVDLRSRNSVTIGTAGFVAERVISFSLRAVSATEPLSEQSDALLEYMQVTIAMGLVAIAQDLSNLLRCILVNSTFQSCPDSFSHIILPPSDNEQTWRLGLPPSSSLVPSLTGTSPSEPVPDQHRRRFWFRRIHNGMTILYVVSLITGLVGNSRLVSERHDQLKTLDNQILRYTNTVLALLLILGVWCAAVWARLNIPQIDKRPLSYLILLSSILVIPAIYRISVMYETTTTYDSTEVGAHNDKPAKAAFYMLHIWPEWAVAFVLCSINVREAFQTGLYGDPHWRDETPLERDRRRKKEKERQGRGADLIYMLATSRFDNGKAAS